MYKFKDKFASGLGSVLEWYDFALYGYFAPIIAKLYFPCISSSTSLIKAFSVFAIGFIARPLGALIFGAISDKYGRINSLKITPILITIPTLIFSILPDYNSIGICAPIILTIIRLCQGICIGGEYANNIVYLCETSLKKSTYFIGSIGSCTSSLGIFLASTVAAICYNILSEQSLLQWGWRIAYSLSVIFGLITYVLRRNMQETPVYREIRRNNLCVKKPVLNSIKFNYKEYFIAIGLIFLPATAFYYIFMFLPSFLKDILNSNAYQILADNSLSLFIRLLIIPLLGLIADKIGGIKIARLSCILFFLTSYPLIFFITKDVARAGVFLFIFSLLTTLNASTTPGLLMNLLKPETRCTMLSLSFNICFGVFGGLVPIIGMLLTTQFENKIMSVFYLMFAAMITFIATFFFGKESTNVYK